MSETTGPGKPEEKPTLEQILVSSRDTAVQQAQNALQQHWIQVGAAQAFTALLDMLTKTEAEKKPE